jgi:hypothetical protein
MDDRKTERSFWLAKRMPGIPRDVVICAGLLDLEFAPQLLEFPMLRTKCLCGVENTTKNLKRK